jgi:hypothetical protein
MKNSCKVVLAACLFLAACTKQAEDFNTSEAATVYAVKYPCGTACTAQGWVLKTANGTTYEPTNLPPPFAANELLVKVAYKKTGKRSAPNSGTGEELIIINSIEKR